MRRSVSNRVLVVVDIVAGVGGRSVDLRGATAGAGSQKN